MTTESALLDSNEAASRFPQAQQRLHKTDLAVLAAVIVLLLLSEVAFYLYIHAGWKVLQTPAAALTADSAGKIWVAGPDGKVWTADGSRLLPAAGSLGKILLEEYETPSALAVDAERQVWVGLSSGDLFLWNVEAGWKRYAPEISGKQGILALMAVAQSGVWASGPNDWGLLIVDDARVTFTYEKFGLNTSAADMATDGQGGVWVLDTDSIVYRLDSGGEWLKLGQNRPVIRMAVDSRGQVWAGKGYPNGEEAHALAPGSSWDVYSFDDNPHMGGSVMDMIFDHHGRLWLAGLGLYHFDPEQGWTVYLPETSGLPHKAINSLAVDGQNQIWIRSYGGQLTVLDQASVLPPPSETVLNRAAFLAVVAIPFAAMAVAWRLSVRYPGSISFQPVRDFIAGLLGWFAVMSLFWLLSSSLLIPLGGPGASGFFMLCVFVPFVPNLVAFIWLFRKRRLLAVGVLAAIAVNSLGIVLVSPAAIPHETLARILGLVPFFL